MFNNINPREAMFFSDTASNKDMFENLRISMQIDVFALSSVHNANAEVLSLAVKLIVCKC